jgi:hypothetical protein
VSDTGGGFAAQKSKSGVGMDNVNRRLQLCYGPEACLDIQSGGGGSLVSFVIPVSPGSLLQSPVSESTAFEPDAANGITARVIEAGD